MKRTGILLLLVLLVGTACCQQKPNIIFVMLDDVGWNDVSWNNPLIKTPHLEKLATEGVILNQSYVQPVCSPSRASLLTGYYPHTMQMDGMSAISATLPHGLPLDRTTLAQRLKTLGYETHAVGKWHLGFCHEKFTPLERGFDTFYGFYLGANDYFTHITETDGVKGLDLRFNKTVVRDKDGVYDTHLWTERAVTILKEHDKSKPLFLYLPYNTAHGPIQAPQKYIDIYSTARKPTKRQIYAGMISALDEGIGQITKAMQENGFINNTVFVFISDNGGQHPTGNNLPLRGGKGTLLEGGVRTPGFVYSPSLLKKKGYTHHGMLHISDWTPTLLSLAGENPSGLDLDGVDQWKMISEGEESKRTEIVHYLWTSSPYGAIRMGDYKLIHGRIGQNRTEYYPDSLAGNQYDETYRQVRQTSWKDLFGRITKRPKGQKGRNTRRPKPNKIRPSRKPGTNGKPGKNKGGGSVKVTWLFNIKDDPLETTDLSTKMPEMVKKLQDRLAEWHKKVNYKAPKNKKALLNSKAANPDNFGGVWSPGWCQVDSKGVIEGNGGTDGIIG